MRDVIYSFDTANLSIRAYAEPEECDPEGHFDFQEDIDAIRNGDVDWFQVAIEVRHKDTGAMLGGDNLGGCAYTHASDFAEGHRDPNPLHRNCSIYRAKYPGSVICHYFPDMIRQACGEVRRSLRKLRSIPVRENA